MGKWTSLALLSVAAVSTLSFPHPGPPIPPVGAGTRAQYYVLKPDGTFTYGYDTGNGLHETATKLESGDVEGEFGYRNADGEDIIIQYTAGEGGFVPRGNILPQPIQVSEVESLSHGSLSQYSAPGRAASVPAATVEIAEIRGGIPEADGSYHFSYDTSSSSRTETADADLNIIGSYSFIADDGISRSIDYKAGSATGFIAEGDHLPQVVGVDFGVRAAPQPSASAPSLTYSDPSVSSVNIVATKSFSPPVPRSDASYSFSYDAGDSARSESADPDLNVVGSYSFIADDGISRSVNYHAGSATGFIAEGDHLPVPVDALTGAGSTAFGNIPAAASYQVPVATSYQVPVTKLSSSPVDFEEAVIRGGIPSADGSYQFSYDTSSSSRSESADADLNVLGSYSYTDDDGISRSVNYKAGSATGFVAEGDHLPKPIVADAEKYTASIDASSSPSRSHGSSFAAVPTVAIVTKSSNPVAASSDASYSFSYNTGDSSRTESADADLNVVGSYSFTADDGVSRSVNYKAGSATGFVAEGDHFPKPAVADSGSSPAASYTAPVTSYAASVAPSTSSNFDDALIRSSFGDDGSYTFSYETDSSSRSETADADLNIVGSYSFTADDGISRSVNYKAGAETGFVAEGDHLPKVSDSESLAAASVKSSPIFAGSNSVEGYNYNVPLVAAASNAIADDGTPSDASYSFSFVSDSYSRNEEADFDGNVKGSYTYLGDDGILRTVNFVAGRETGFVPEGEYIEASGSSGPSASHRATSLASSSVSTTSYQASAVSAHPVVSYAAPSHSSNVATEYSAPPTVSGNALDSIVIGDVKLVHANAEASPSMFGYSFTAI